MGKRMCSIMEGTRSGARNCGKSEANGYDSGQEEECVSEFCVYKPYPYTEAGAAGS